MEFSFIKSDYNSSANDVTQEKKNNYGDKSMKRYKRPELGIFYSLPN